MPLMDNRKNRAFGKMNSDFMQFCQIDRSELTLHNLFEEAWKRGYEAAIRNYGVWKDHAQYILVDDAGTPIPLTVEQVLKEDLDFEKEKKALV